MKGYSIIIVFLTGAILGALVCREETERNVLEGQRIYVRADSIFSEYRNKVHYYE